MSTTDCEATPKGKAWPCCARPEGHDGQHESADFTWGDDGPPAWRKTMAGSGRLTLEQAPPGPLSPEALIHDLAIVLANALHRNAQLGPSGHMAARRVRDVLRITEGERTAAIEARISAALADAP